MDFTTTKLLHGGDYNPEQWLDRRTFWRRT